MGLADFFSNLKGNPGWHQKFQEASPLLMAFGQQLQTPRHMRDPQTLQLGVAQMQQAKEKRQQQAQQKAQREAIAKGVGELKQTGTIPSGLAEMMAVMDPEKVLPSLLDYMEPKDPQRYNMGNGILVDANGKEIYTAPAEPEYRTVGNELLQLGPDGVKSLYKGAEKAPPNFRVNPDGTYEYIPGSAADPDLIRQQSAARGKGDGMTVYGPDGNPLFTTGDPGKVVKLTEQQGKFTLFGSMMDKTMPVINELEERFNPANLADAAASRLGTFGNFFESKEYQKYEAAGKAWAEGVLRLQTGAAAPPAEVQNVFETYFAQPGNSPETVQYKRELRQAFAESVGLASGGLVSPGQSAQAPASSTAPMEYNGKQYVWMNDEWHEVVQ